MAFYDLDEIERVALTERAMAKRRSLTERWFDLAAEEAEPWNARTGRAAELLRGETGVLDLGSGTGTLELYLEAGTAYWPCDITKRDHRTIVVDLNREPVPATPASAVACLGVLEYLYDPAFILKQLARSYRLGVFSYCTTDSPTPLVNRRSHAWVNDYDRSGIERMFSASDWHIDLFEQHSEFQGLWRLTSVSNNSDCD